MKCNPFIECLQKLKCGECSLEDYEKSFQSLSSDEQKEILYWQKAATYPQNKEIYIDTLYEKLLELPDEMLDGPFVPMCETFNLGWGTAIQIRHDSFQNNDPKLVLINTYAWIPEDDHSVFPNNQYRAAQNDVWCLKHCSSGISDIRIEKLMFAAYGDEKQAYYAATFRLDENFLCEKIQLPEDIYTTHRNYILGIPDLRVVKDIWLGEITEDGLTILQHITN